MLTGIRKANQRENVSVPEHQRRSPLLQPNSVDERAIGAGVLHKHHRLLALVCLPCFQKNPTVLSADVVEIELVVGVWDEPAKHMLLSVENDVVTLEKGGNRTLAGLANHETELPATW